MAFNIYDSRNRFLFRKDQLGFPGVGGILALASSREVCPVDEFRDARQQRAVGLGGDRITETFVRPVECADTALSW